MNQQCNSDSEYHIAGQTVLVRDLGSLSYAPAFELQKTTNQAVSEQSASHTIFLVEHTPVITITPKPEVKEHIVASKDLLQSLGIEVCETDRGGDITYHGPGQLVVYPILRLNPFNLNLSRYMRLLEQAVINTIADFNITGIREPGNTGVWVPLSSTHTPKIPGLESMAPQSEKICAMGVRIRKNTTMHGLALNITTDLTHFDTIVPCGLTGRGVTSLTKLLHSAAPDMPTVKKHFVNHMINLLQDAAEGRFNI